MCCQSSYSASAYFANIDGAKNRCCVRSRRITYVYLNNPGSPHAGPIGVSGADRGCSVSVAPAFRKAGMVGKVHNYASLLIYRCRGRRVTNTHTRASGGLVEREKASTAS